MVTNTDALEKPHLLKHFQGLNCKMLMMKRGCRKQALTVTSAGMIFMIPLAGSL
jgi:hypothetical protein